MAQDLPENVRPLPDRQVPGRGGDGSRLSGSRHPARADLVALKVPKLKQRVSLSRGRAQARTQVSPDRPGGASEEEKETPDSETLERFFREARSGRGTEPPQHLRNPRHRRDRRDPVPDDVLPGRADARGNGRARQADGQTRRPRRPCARLPGRCRKPTTVG